MRRFETSAWPRPAGGEATPAETEILLGQFSALLRQIGSPEEAVDGIASVSMMGRWEGVEGVRGFLEDYQRRVLGAVELPALARARFHAARGEARELIELDRQLKARPPWAPFGAASRRIGRTQIERMRPLRDERTVQRYLAAVEAGEAEGWHTLVYGLTLAVYAWPLRPGLVNYASETLTGLARATGRARGFAEADLEEILQTLLARVPEAVERTVAEGPG